MSKGLNFSVINTTKKDYTDDDRSKTFKTSDEAIL